MNEGMGKIAEAITKLIEQGSPLAWWAIVLYAANQMLNYLVIMAIFFGVMVVVYKLVSRWQKHMIEEDVRRRGPG